MSRTETASTTIAHPDCRRVIVGVDTHGEVHVACALDQLGRRLAIADFATTPAGYRALLEWAGRLGQVAVFGVEGCGWDGAGWPASSVSRASWSWRSTGPTAPPAGGGAGPTHWMPRRRPGRCWPARSPRSPRPAATWWRWCGVCGWPGPPRPEARSQAVNALRALVVTAPPELREQLRGLPASRLAGTAAQLEPGPILTTTAATKLALRLLGERCAALDTEVARLDAELDRLTAQAAPRLRQLCGIGPEIAGALLAAGSLAVAARLLPEEEVSGS